MDRGRLTKVGVRETARVVISDTNTNNNTDTNLSLTLTRSALGLHVYVTSIGGLD